MSIATDGFGSIIAALETGGGGGGVLPPDDNISGDYTNNLISEGDVYVTGPLEVMGSMVVRGDFINDGGWPVTIHGDLYAQAIYFNHADPTQPQSNFQVDGDLIFTQMNFRQSGGYQALLRVGGNLIGAAGFSGTLLNGSGVDGSLGVPGSPGLSVLVYGDLIVTDVQLYGGENLAGAAGNGGNLVVYGDCLTAYNLDLSGGAAANGDAGYGGTVDVYGDLSVPDGTLSVRGGTAQNGNAGNAGSVYVDTNFTGSEISAYGGNCFSDSELHRSGSGGNVYVYGQVTWANSITVSGGDRYGTLSTGGANTPPHAGYIEARGGLSCSDLNARGGRVWTGGFAPHDAGDGGTLNVDGFLNVADDLQFEGGFADVVGNGGNGGYVNVEGHASIEDDFDINGGYAGNGNGGNGGSGYFYGDLNIDEVRLEGGSATNGNGGNGAYLFVKGNLTVNEFYDGAGGYCNSANELHHAGSGGGINVEGEFRFYGDDDDLILSGGDRFGATSAPNPVGIAANGGTLTVGGDFISRAWVYSRGGGVYTDYQNAPGGSGGYLMVKGDCIVDGGISLEGGHSVANIAGNGGTMNVRGHTTADAVLASGGNSAESILTGDAGQAGPPGNVTFRGGMTISGISMLDGTFGAGGSAPNGLSELHLNGTCIVNDINMSARANVYIRKTPWADTPVMLKVNSLPTKNTLNDSAGTATGDVSASLASSMFLTGPGGVWYAVAGVLVP